MSEENNVDRPMNWGDMIEHDSADFVLLPEGEYNFEVKSFRRETFSGSAKMGACPMAVLDLEVFMPTSQGEWITICISTKKRKACFVSFSAQSDSENTANRFA